jgi:hypothetical protein
MSDPDAQAQKLMVPAIAENIPQTIVPTVAATLLQPGHPGWQVDFVIYNQQSITRNFVIIDYRTHSLSAVIHEGHRFHQDAVLAVQAGFGQLGVKLRLGS